MTEQPKETVQGVLSDVATMTKAMQHLVRKSFESSPSLSGPDLLLMGVLKRAMSTSRGFISLVNQTNFLCAAPLVRFQLDSALRFYGVLITEEPNQAAKRILGGARVDRMRDANGERLQDRHLVKRLSAFYPWIERVYEQASGYVHLSAAHMFAPVHDVNDDGALVTFVFTEEDVCVPPQKWLELVIAFRETTQLVGEVFAQWLSGRPQS